MPSYRFVTADVFTATPFGGNQLAVFPEASGLSSEQMQSIAGEFNFSETTFVVPPEDTACIRRVRIFTPASELPFAGHPTVGTAHVLAALGEIPLTGDVTRVALQEGVGPVPVLIRSKDGQPGFCQLTAAKLPEASPPLPPRDVLAPMLSLETDDLLDGVYHPQAVSCGVPFSFIPVRDRRAVARARLRLDLWEETLSHEPHHMVMVFAMDAEDRNHQVRARMFGPGSKVPEDPATGSACAALGGYLAWRNDTSSGTLRWIVEQGYEMGRPSILEIETDKVDGKVSAVRVGGDTVIMTEGRLRL